jgi:hypothetical protein
MLSFSNLEIYTQACQNSPAGVWGAIAPVGIQTNMPAKPLHILGLLQCPDPAIRLEYQPYIGHLALQTPGNPFYSTISTPGDMILQADFYAGDILLTTRNNTSSIRFATTPPLSMVDNERMTIIPDGNVGINNNNPVSKFQVTDGSVLFNGTTGSTPVTDAGTRFMWIPEKAALRAGYVDGTQWNTIGNYSVALGKNNEASNNLGFAVGDANITGGHWPGMALGFRNRTFDAGEGYEGDESIAIGSDCNAYGWASIAMGKEATVTYATELGFAFGLKLRLVDNNQQLWVIS